MGPLQSQVGKEFNEGGSYVFMRPPNVISQLARGRIYRDLHRGPYCNWWLEKGLRCDNQQENCDMRYRQSLQYDNRWGKTKLYCGERETLQYTISQLQNNRGDGLICMKKRNGSIENCYGLSDLWYSLLLHFKETNTHI